MKTWPAEDKNCTVRSCSPIAVTAPDSRGGPVTLNSDWPRISGSSAGYRFHMPVVGIMEEGRSPTGMRPTTGGQDHAAIVAGRLSK